MRRVLLLVFFAQSLWAQLPPPDNKEFSLPSDKTPEQILALVALNFGIREFNHGARDKAITYFREANRLDPKLLNARLYLATVYSTSYVPSDTSSQNQKNAETALAEFEDVLAQDSGNLSALDGLGSLRFQMAQTPFNRELLLSSKDYFRKHVQLKRTDVEPFYWIGVIDWTLASHANRELRASRQLEDGPFPMSIREEYAKEFGPTIDEGIASLKNAIAIRSDYDDAMAYLNLLYRRKADAAGNQVEREDLLRQADDLIGKVKQIKANRAKSVPSEIGKQHQ